MNKHTPGPWLFRGKSNSVYTTPPTGSVYTYGSIIFSFHDVAEPSDADLALILAAPDLLEALELLLGKAYKQNFNDSYPEILEKAEAAIAKAKEE